MSGYTPVFRSVFQGSLCGQYPDTAAWLFMLALADKNGEVDMTPQYIAAVTGMPVDDLTACIDRFMQPDPSSRGQELDGRRLVLIDEARPWGWRIVNHSKYREKARKATFDAQRVESGRNRERMAERRATTRDDPTRPATTRANPPSDTNTDTDTDTEGASAPIPRKRGRASAKTGLPKDLTLTPDLIQYAVGKLSDVDPSALFEKFTGQAVAKGWEYANWRQAFQEYVRNCEPNSGHWAAGQYPRKSMARERWI